MQKLYLFVICMVVLLISGCGVYEGLSKDVSTVSPDDIVLEGDNTTEVVSDETVEEVTTEEETELPPSIDLPPEETTEESMEEVTGEAVEETAEETTEEVVEEEEATEETTEEVVEEEEEATEETTEEVVEEEEEAETPESSEDAIVIIVEENDFVSLKPQAEDPDQDVLSYSFTSPLDDQGEWQTNYGDEGSYTVTVTASDGYLSASQDVLLIVNRKEEVPTIDSLTPEDQAITLDEDNELDFDVEASDLNGDSLTYEWKLDGEVVSTDTSFEYAIDYNSAGSHTVKVTISDGTTEATQIWSITINNVNRPPVLEPIEPISMKETETLIIEPVVNDPDGDDITFTIEDPIGDDGIWETGYNDAGDYVILITASDGELEASTEVSIKVADVNRPPVITGIELG